MAATISQQIAAAEAKLARLRKRNKASETRVKIITGAVVIADALKNESAARSLATLMRRDVKRDADQAVVADLLARLDAVGRTPK